MRRDDQDHDHHERASGKYQDHREDVLENPVPACHPLPFPQRNSRPGRMIARGSIVQTRPERASPPRAEPDHDASRHLLLPAYYRQGAGNRSLQTARMGHDSERAAPRPSQLAREWHETAVVLLGVVPDLRPDRGTYRLGGPFPTVMLLRPGLPVTLVLLDVRGFRLVLARGWHGAC